MKVATRVFEFDQKTYLLLTDPDSLRSEISLQGCWVCSLMDHASFEKSRFGSAVARFAQVPKDAKPMLVDSGLKRSENHARGAILSADLCPSLKPLDRPFLEQLARLQTPAPIAFSISGVWLKHHRDDFDWLKGQQALGHLNITWMNHSYRHPYDKDHPSEGNFLLTPGVNLSSEVLRTEQLLIENGATPSVFFRFPGLISGPELMAQLKSFSLIPVGTDSWLSQGAKPTDDSIMLIHANGNEPAGLVRFQKLNEGGHLPLPLRPLDQGPRR